MPDLPFEGASKIRGNTTRISNTDTLTEADGPSTWDNEKFPDELIPISPTLENTEDYNQNTLSCYEEYDETNKDSTMTHNIYRWQQRE